MVKPDSEFLKKEFQASELRSLAEMSIFCGIILSLLVLLTTNLLMDEPNPTSNYVALFVLMIGCLWLVFFRSVPTFKVRAMVLPLHLSLASLLAFAIYNDHYGNRAVESVPYFAVSMILVLLCPFKGLVLLLCALYYSSALAFVYQGEPRYADMVTWHLAAMAVIVLFRHAYHRWSLSRIEYLMRALDGGSKKDSKKASIALNPSYPSE
jgi:hypothetical protein